MGGDQRQPDENRIADRRDRGRAQSDAEHQRDDAVSAMRAVAHDRELALAIPAAAEPVGRVGEPVLVQRAGRGDAGGDREQRGRPDRQAEQPGDKKRDGAQRADAASDQRESPAGSGDRAGLGRLRRERKSGQHAGGDREFVNQAAPRVHVAERHSGRMPASGPRASRPLAGRRAGGREQRYAAALASRAARYRIARHASRLARSPSRPFGVSPAAFSSIATPRSTWCGR